MKIKSLKSSCKLTATLAMFGAVLLTGANAWATGSPNLVIAEVYGGGGNSGSTYKNDFIVVFNRSTSGVDVNGWSVQYASASGTTWQVTPLAAGIKIIPAGGYFLVQEAAGAGGTTSLPTPDATGAINMSGSAGKVALVNNTTALTGQVATGTGAGIVDFVGFGTANGFEGSGAAPAPGSAAVSDQRASQGCTDTDQNNIDFSTASANPRNSSSPTHSCVVVTPPTIASILPSSITTNAGNIVNFTVTNSAGDAPLTYFWYKETGSTTNLISTVTSGATATLTLSNVILADAASYQVVVSNASLVTATSAVVSLSVVDPAINTQPPPAQTLLLNSTVLLKVGAGGTPTVGCQWYTGTPGSGTPVGNGGRISGANTTSLSISSLAGGDANTYFAVVTNVNGSVTSSVTALTVVANNGPLAYWDFNGTLVDPNAPAPTYGAGTAAPVNVLPFLLPPNVGDGNDIDNASAEGLINGAWGTQNYPAQGLSNKLAGVRFNVSTVGAKNVKVSYDNRGTTTASKYERLQFTTNGTDFIDFPTSSSFTASGSFPSVPLVFNLTGFPGVRNNPNFGVRIVTEFESTALYGNTNNANYVPISGSYSGSGTISYDMVKISADAITDANTPPTITAIPDQTVKDTVGGNVNFTVGDAETAAGSLGVTAASADPTVSVGLAVNNLGGGSRQLVISSSLGNPANVNVPILVTATDGNGDSTVTWFTLTITPANAPPVLTGLINTNLLPNKTLVIPFTLTDDHTDPNTIVPTMVSGNSALVTNDVAHLALGGSGTSRTLTITPTANQLGTVPITVSASDGSLNTSQTIILTVRPNTNVVLIDNFGYDTSGSLVTYSSGFWQTHSGTPNQLAVGGGAATIDGVNHGEDVNAPLIGGPYVTNGPAVLYSSFIINYTTLPDLTGAYFAHFKDNTVFGFLARVWAITNAASGGYRIGIANSSDTAVQFPQNLALGSNYVIVTRLVLSNSFSTVWVNPGSESSPSVTDTFDITTNRVGIYSFALRESNISEGIVNLSHLKVGLTFDSVLPSVQVQPSGTKVIINWSDPTLTVQSATNVTGPYLDMATTPPSTNSTVTNGVMFFRFKP